MKQAVDAAENAFKEWSQTSVPTRCRIMFRLRDLIEKHTVLSILLFLLSSEIESDALIF